MLGETSGSLDKFKAALKENGAEFPVSSKYISFDYLLKMYLYRVHDKSC